jgi:DNA (cytosine-5)-methyltransferase 1
MPNPRLLDLFCGAGGSAVGYHRAGFEVVGVDIKPQPNYPFQFIQGDAMSAMDALLNPDPELFFAVSEFDAIHASPPCQFRTAYRRRPMHVKPSPNLIPPIRELLLESGLPYVIENVEYARDQLREPIMLCGSSVGLDVRRHRLFESNVVMMGPPCAHAWQRPRFTSATNREHLRKTIEIGAWRIPMRVQEEGMGINWMSLDELSAAIPPAYTELIGFQLMAEVEHRRALVV